MLLAVGPSPEQRCQPASKSVGGPEAHRHAGHEVLSSVRVELLVEHGAPLAVPESEACLGQECERGGPHGVLRDPREVVRGQLVEHPLRRVEHAELGVQGRQAWLPHGRGIGRRGDDLHEWRDLGQPPLGAADRIHLQPIHTGVIRRTVCRAFGERPLGGCLGSVQIAGGKVEHGLIGVRHELEGGEVTGAARRAVALEHLPRLGETAEHDACPKQVGVGVRRGPGIAQPVGDLGQLGADGEVTFRVLDRNHERLERDGDQLVVAQLAGQREGGFRRSETIRGLSPEHQCPAQ